MPRPASQSGESRTMARIVLVGCSKKKQKITSRAADLYTSPRFLKAKRFAESHSDRWYVLSAKHGLLLPNDEIAPYDLSLDMMDVQERARWATEVLDALEPCVSPGDEVTILAGPSYQKDVARGLTAMGAKVHAPLESQPIGRQLRLLNEMNRPSKKEADTSRLYGILDRLSIGLGGLVSAGSALAREDIPVSGVYFFFEPTELRSDDPSKLRVVRVGTHGVSKGSRATLRDRLRAHLGTEDGGNHRTSIFREHLGESYLNHEGRLSEVPSWGNKGAISEKALLLEEEVEKWVSKYIRTMFLLWVAVEGEADKRGARATIEKNAIALLSGGVVQLHPPSADWLGKWSTRPAVRSSGLWNVQHTHDIYRSEFLDSLEGLVDSTVVSQNQPPARHITDSRHPDTKKPSRTLGEFGG